jgi:hypothetical protein
MYKKLFLFLGLVFVVNLSVFSQVNKDFQFHRPNKKSYRIPFVNYKNLIIIKASLNGIPMNLLLDTGVDNTILFGIEGNEEYIKKNSQKILIKGVSGKKKTYAYKSENNTLKIDKLTNASQDVYLIFDKDFNISDKIGYQVQGIIGYDFFKDLIVRINYTGNYLKVFNPDRFSRKLKRYDQFDIKLINQKPYIKTKIKQQNQAFEDYVFLLDIGSGDAIWLKSLPDQTLPEKSFYDILGYGFADIITGVRSKAEAFKLGRKTIKTPKVAYPDSLSYKGLAFTSKSGVIGSEIMRRFHWFFDYANRKVYLKPNSDINDIFNYDMSGLLLKYEGYQAITTYKSLFPDVKTQTDNRSGYNKIKKPKGNVMVEMQPILKVGAVRPKSSAFEAGFIAGDKILKINGRSSYRYDLEELNELLCSREGLEINFVIERNGSQYDKSLVLKSRFLE